MTTNNDYILDILLKEESPRCIYIANPKSENIAKLACAMANTFGGTLLLGVDNDKSIQGISESFASDLTKELLSTIRPALPFSLSKIERDDKLVVLVSIWEGANKPYAVNGRFYVAKNDTCQEVNAYEVSNLFLQRQNQNMNWERETLGDATIDDLDMEAIAQISSRLIEDGRLQKDCSPHDVLMHLGFIKYGNITNAGCVVLCKHPSLFFPQTRIRVSVWGENNELQEVRLFDGSLVKSVKEIVDYLYGFYPSNMIFEGIQRTSKETLPFVALREGVLNSVIHRIYADYKSFVNINVYSNRVEIINSGKLMNGMTVDSMKRGHFSILRNPDIANVFYILRYIEAAGSGINRILDECRKNGCKLPEWVVENGYVRLTFYANRAQMKNEREVDLLEGLSVDNNVRNELRKVVEYLNSHENVKSIDIQNFLGKSYATAKRYMHILKDSGIIEYRGSLKTGGWYLVSQ